MINYTLTLNPSRLILGDGEKEEEEKQTSDDERDAQMLPNAGTNFQKLNHSEYTPHPTPNTRSFATVYV